MFSDNVVSIPLGIIVGLLASFVQSLGLTIQRKSHVQNQALPEHRQRVEHRRPLWLLGFAIFISSNILGSFVQIASLPVVILAPLGAVSLLWNAFFARILLGDVFSPWMILGTILIAGGAVLIAIFGIVPEQTRSLEDLLALFRRPTFIVYFSLLGFVVVVCLAITHISEFSLSRRISKTFPSDDSSIDLSPSSVNINLPPTQATNLTTSIVDEIHDTTLATERTPLLDRKSGTVSPNGKPVDDSNLVAINRTRLMLAISYASFSGIISGMCLLFAKSGVELLLLTMGGKNQFWRWEAWMLLLGLVAFALLQLWYLHKALILADPTLVCPSAFCFYNLSSIVNGLVYFDQFALIRPLYLGIVALGIVVLLAGVWVVSIQPGGGVDVGTWSEEEVEFTDDDAALYADEEGQITPAETVRMTQSNGRRPQQRLPIVPMDRETHSESSVPNITPEALLGLGIDTVTETPEIEESGDKSQPKRPKRAETGLYTERRTPSQRLRRRPTADARASSTSSQTAGHSRAVSHPNPHHPPLSPPLGGTVPTIGAGFQIGLSPLSPGFTIMPNNRRRQSGVGIGGPSFADVVHEAMGNERERRGLGAQERRRTVSEGEVARRNRGLGIDGNGEPGVADEDFEAGHEGGEGETTRTLHDGELGGNDKKRWRWLRRVFSPGAHKDKD